MKAAWRVYESFSVIAVESSIVLAWKMPCVARWVWGRGIMAEIQTSKLSEPLGIIIKVSGKA
jgi:hypothetical protein